MGPAESQVRERLQAARELSVRDPRARGDAMEQLVRQWHDLDDEALPYLIEALDDEDQTVSGTAALALRRLDSDRVFRRMSVLLRDPEGRKFMVALRWLADHPRPETPDLVRALALAGPLAGRHAAVTVLQAHGDRRSAEILTEVVEQLESAEDLLLAGRAARTLRERDSDRARAALEHFRRVAPSRIAASLDHPAWAPRLIELLGTIGTQAAIGFLLDRLEKEADESRQALIFAQLARHAENPRVARAVSRWDKDTRNGFDAG